MGSLLGKNPKHINYKAIYEIIHEYDLNYYNSISTYYINKCEI